MIKISLLPVKRSKKREAAARELTIAGGLFAVVVLALYIAYALMDSRLSDVDEKLQHATAEVARLEKDILKVDEFKQKKHELESKLTVIDDLKAKKTGPVKLLDELASNIPRRVWLTSFEEKNQAMLLEGGAADNDDLSDFLGYVTKRSKYFNQGTLVYSETVAAGTTPADKVSYVKFKMTGTANYGSQPASQPTTAKDK